MAGREEVSTGEAESGSAPGGLTFADAADIVGETMAEQTSRRGRLSEFYFNRWEMEG